MSLPLGYSMGTPFFGKPMLVMTNPRDPAPTWSLGFVFAASATPGLPDGSVAVDLVVFEPTPGASDGQLGARLVTAALFTDLATATAAAGTASTTLSAIACTVADPSTTP